MPYINVKTNVSIPKNTQMVLKEQLGQAIQLFPGKSEKWLMVSFEPDSAMWFMGRDAPAAIAEVNLFGSASPSEYAAFTKKICEMLAEKLSILPARVYVKYQETPYWGWNGENF